MKNFIKFIFIMTLILFTGCENKEAEQVKHESIKQNHEITLTDIYGKKLTLIRKNSAFVVKGDEDKIIMIDIFGTFCPPCQKEASELMQYQIQNNKDFKIIALTHYEDVTDEYIIEEFAKKYNAYYFITNNQKINNQIIEQIIMDIKYEDKVGLPFKVILKNGEYQILTENNSGKFGFKYYIGGLNFHRFENDMKRIRETK